MDELTRGMDTYGRAVGRALCRRSTPSYGGRRLSDSRRRRRVWRTSDRCQPSLAYPLTPGAHCSEGMAVACLPSNDRALPFTQMQPGLLTISGRYVPCLFQGPGGRLAVEAGGRLWLRVIDEESRRPRHACTEMVRAALEGSIATSAGGRVRWG